MIEMHFYVTRTPDGLLHVQNILMGLSGQHHVHTEKSFELWREGIADHAVHLSDGTCDCDLGLGDVRDHNGHVWHNDKFAASH